VSDTNPYHADTQTSNDEADLVKFYVVDAQKVVGSSFPNPEDALIANEKNNALDQAITNLSPALQAIVYLLQRGLKPVEISQKLGVSKAAVSKNMKVISKSLININITINS
jgi:RNA polymerase sigma factor (sigma-70 family)